MKLKHKVTLLKARRRWMTFKRVVRAFILPPVLRGHHD